MYYKRYTGRTDGSVRVSLINRATNTLVRSYELPPRLDLANHSPTGFAWGYGGSGPAQLALAILADALGSGREGDALAFHHAFKWSRIAHIPHDSGWVVTSDEVRRFVETAPGTQMEATA